MSDEARTMTDEERREEARRLQARHAEAKHAAYAAAPAGTEGRPTAHQRQRGGPTDSRKYARPSLVRTLIDDVAVLIRKELALAFAEVRQSIGRAKGGLVSASVGSGVLYTGIFFLMLAATLGLAQVLPGWLAALIVGALLALIGLSMVRTGTRKASSTQFVPERTIRSLKKDKQVVT